VVSEPVGRKELKSTRSLESRGDRDDEVGAVVAVALRGSALIGATTTT